MFPIVLIIFVTKNEKLGTKDQTRIARCTVIVFLSLLISKSSLECLCFIAFSDLKRPGSYFILLPSIVCSQEQAGVRCFSNGFQCAS